MFDSFILSERRFDRTHIDIEKICTDNFFLIFRSSTMCKFEEKCSYFGILGKPHRTILLKP